MLAKKFRLPINAFPVKAKILHKSQHLTVKTNPNKVSHQRLGIVISKKTAPRATTRNRLRRKIFDFAAPKLNETRLRSRELRRSEGGLDLLVIVKPIKLDREKEEELLDEWHRFLRKLI